MAAPRWFRRVVRSLPRRRHLRGGRLHRLMGEKLLAPELWRFSRVSVCGGLAVGVFIGLTPTIGVQSILAALAAVFLRVNVPAALVATLISNPFTAPFIFTLEYQLGVRLFGTPEAGDLETYSGTLRRFVSFAKPLWAGSLLAASVAAGVVYGLVYALWRPKRTE